MNDHIADRFPSLFNTIKVRVGSTYKHEFFLQDIGFVRLVLYLCSLLWPGELDILKALY